MELLNSLKKMYIEELKEGDAESVEQQVCSDVYKGAMVVWDPKRLLVGAGARALFYPTLLYNVVRNKIQTEFRWWDRVDEVSIIFDYDTVLYLLNCNLVCLWDIIYIRCVV